MATGCKSDLEQFLKLQESLHGPNSIQAGEAAYRLAKWHIGQSELSKAEVLLGRVLKIFRAEFGGGHAKTSKIQSELEQIVALNRSCEIEIPENLRVSSDRIASLAKAGEELHPEHVRHSGADLLAPLEAAMKEVKELRKSKTPTLLLADALVKLAFLYNERGMTEDMEEPLSEALWIRETVCGANHLSVSTDLKNLARVYYFAQDFQKAEPLLRRALKIRQDALGQLHPYAADIGETYAKLLRKTNRQEEAEEMENLVRTSRSTYGNEWQMYRDAATKAAESEDYFSAQAFWLAALDEANNFRFDDPRLSLTLESLAEVYWRQLKYEKAEPLCKRILQIWESLLGADHPDVATAANNLAMLCERQGKHIEAAILYQQVLSIRENGLGNSHPDVALARESWQRTRQMAQEEVKLKVAKAEGKWNRSGWYHAYQKGNS